MIDKYTLRREIVVEASQEKAFRVFTQRFDAWWPREHHIGKADMKEAIMESHTNGRWYEKGVDGSECEWGRVLTWDPPNRLLLAWQLTSTWEYDPNFVTEVEVTFESQGPNRTLVALEHRNLDRFGADAEKMRAGFDADGGWASLLQLFANEAMEDIHDHTRATS